MYYSVHNKKQKKLRLAGALPLILHQRERPCSQGRNQRRIIAPFGEQHHALKVREQRLCRDSRIQSSGYDPLFFRLTQHPLKVTEPFPEKPLHPRANQFILRAHLQRQIAYGASVHMTSGLLLSLLLLQHQVKETHHLLLRREVIGEGWSQDRLFKPLPLALKGYEHEILLG